MRKLAILNLFGFAVMITVNLLANILPIAGRTTGGVSEFIDNLFVPAPFTFSIWGLIYLLVAAFVVTSLVSKNETITKIVSRIGILFFITCLINSAWLFAWHYLQLIPSMILMVGFLVTLLIIYVKLEKLDIAPFGLASLTMRLPFQVYAGWISVATIANMAAMLTFYKFDGFGIDPQLWTVTMIAIATLLGIIILFKNRYFAYPAVVLWALWGIYKKRTGDLAAADRMIEVGCLTMMVVIALGMVARLVMNRKAPIM